MDENLEWLTENAKDPKSNQGNLTFLVTQFSEDPTPPPPL